MMGCLGSVELPADSRGCCEGLWIGECANKYPLWDADLELQLSILTFCLLSFRLSQASNHREGHNIHRTRTVGT